jgi:hypothetical protein
MITVTDRSSFKNCEWIMTDATMIRNLNSKGKRFATFSSNEESRTLHVSNYHDSTSTIIAVATFACYLKRPP